MEEKGDVRNQKLALHASGFLMENRKRGRKGFVKVFFDMLKTNSEKVATLKAAMSRAAGALDTEFTGELMDIGGVLDKEAVEVMFKAQRTENFGFSERNLGRFIDYLRFLKTRGVNLVDLRLDGWNLAEAALIAGHKECVTALDMEGIHLSRPPKAAETGMDTLTFQALANGWDSTFALKTILDAGYKLPRDFKGVWLSTRKPRRVGLLEAVTNKSDLVVAREKLSLLAERGFLPKQPCGEDLLHLKLAAGIVTGEKHCGMPNSMEFMSQKAVRAYLLALAGAGVDMTEVLKGGGDRMAVLRREAEKQALSAVSAGGKGKMKTCRI